MHSRRLLQVSRSAWENKDPQSFHKLLLLKMMMIFGIVGIAFPLYVTVFIRQVLDHIFFLQISMWLTCLIAFIKVREDSQIRVASLIIINLLTFLLLSILISSGIGDNSGAYHHVVPILIAASFLLGPRFALPYFILFFGFYLLMATGLWERMLPGVIARIHPARTSVYVDRLLEISCAFGLSIMFDRMKKSQQERIKLQEHEVAKKEKQLSINRMAGGIAHEINNPLAILLGYLELLERHEFTRKDLERINPRIQLAAKRIQFVVWSLNQLNNSQENGSGVTLLDAALRDAETRIRDLKAQISLKFASGTGIKVRLLADDLQNILYTILVNSVEALGNKPDAAIELRVLVHEPQIIIEVRDNGDLAVPHDLAKFADPFFTTKLDRPGRGMGLTLASAIVQKAGGQLVFKREGSWTVVTMSLPGFAVPVLKIS